MKRRWLKDNHGYALDYGRKHRTPLNKEYQRAYQRKRRNTYKVWARAIANVRYKGDARFKRCVLCGTDKNVDKAHVDYRRPLYVVPLCRIHHHKFDSSVEFRRQVLMLVKS